MVRVKICGITNERDMRLAVEFGADALGFIFYEKSPRKISPAQCKNILKKYNPLVMKTGVFVNEKKEKVLKTLKECRLQALQFHGGESPAYCDFFKKYALVTKAFNLKDEKSLEQMEKYKVDGYLVDAYHPVLKGGTGKVLNLALAKKAAKLKRPLILSGGLNPRNVLFYLKQIKPDMVDVASGIEKRPGGKDIKKMRDFIRQVKNYAAE